MIATVHVETKRKQFTAFSDEEQANIRKYAAEKRIVYLADMPDLGESTAHLFQKYAILFYVKSARRRREYFYWLCRIKWADLASTLCRCPGYMQINTCIENISKFETELMCCHLQFLLLWYLLFLEFDVKLILKLFTSVVSVTYGIHNRFINFVRLIR